MSKILEARADDLHKIAITYGEGPQMRQATEEMAELIVALNKYYRASCHIETNPDKVAKTIDGIAEEVADVKIMMEQLEIFLPIGDKVEQIIGEKLDRQLKRIGGSNGKKQ